ncbi:tripartite tricarboxylate transporter substrate binding protein [uncultured Thiothrix sp.]|uniref:Bug family tripartite tricarboxylate transporter substrate binding protein n=1 Tax=uncultured Thiothrix sp. TaxID=223185 RepID=UPI0026185EB9|nr:tripartite tricarboxylate transporter substrate binding protein [uncultured Thiothrix sp.]HMT93242.1 tripartite tricarboxylate transporter substrate binding protein [Thiolinea sp.]
MKRLPRLMATCLLTLAPLSLTHAEIDQFKIMAPANPGGGWDTIARTLGDALKANGQAKNVVVENKAGAGGTIGMAQFINNEKGNPNALLVAGAITVGAIETNKSPVNFSMVAPIARLMGEYDVLVVPENSPYKTLTELMDAVKKDPGSVSFGGGSAGGVDHIIAGLMAETVGVEGSKVNYIPFAGGGEGKAAILGGQVTAYLSGYGELADLITAQKVRALGVSSDKKIDGVDIPTMKEQGVDVVLANWRAVFGAPDIKEEEKAALIKLVEEAVKSPTWQDKAKASQWTDMMLTGDDFKKFLEEEQKVTAETLKKLKIGG